MTPPLPKQALDKFSPHLADAHRTRADEGYPQHVRGVPHIDCGKPVPIPTRAIPGFARIKPQHSYDLTGRGSIGPDDGRCDTHSCTARPPPTTSPCTAVDNFSPHFANACSTRAAKPYPHVVRWLAHMRCGKAATARNRPRRCKHTAGQNFTTSRRGTPHKGCRGLSTCCACTATHALWRTCRHGASRERAPAPSRQMRQRRNGYPQRQQ